MIMFRGFPPAAARGSRGFPPKFTKCVECAAFSVNFARKIARNE
jgi:hypothetical protein